MFINIVVLIIKVVATVTITGLGLLLSGGIITGVTFLLMDIWSTLPQ